MLGIGRSWQRAAESLLKNGLCDDEQERCSESPLEEFVELMEAVRFDFHFFHLIDLAEDGLEGFFVGRSEELAAPDFSEFSQGTFVDADGDLLVGDASEHVFDGDGCEAFASGADGVEANAEGSGGFGGAVGADLSGVVITVGEEHEDAGLRIL